MAVGPSALKIQDFKWKTLCNYGHFQWEGNKDFNFNSYFYGLLLLVLL